MEIIHNQNSFLTLNKIRGGKTASDSLQNSEKELLHQMAEALTVVYGGHFKRRRQTA